MSLHSRVHPPASDSEAPVWRSARRVTLVDDLDQGEADETVELGDAATYEIDLSRRRTLRSCATRSRTTRARPPTQLSGRRGAGRAALRPASSAGPSRPSGRASGDREQNQAIREWARRHGLTVSARGRIVAEVTEAYHKAH
jgi:hypothetical protein